MKVYRFDEETKKYINAEEAFIDPLESELQGKDIYLLPANCTSQQPPEPKDGYKIKWSGTAWEYEEIPKEPEPEPPTEEEIQQQLTAAVQRHMDATAQTRNYDNIHTACTYATSTDPTFKAEGTACVAWRDAVWRKCYDILAEVQAGSRAIPTADELIAELPVLEW